MNAHEVAGGREGFTLVETIVAMVLTAVILTALVPPMLYVAQQQRLLAAEAEHSSTLEAGANRLMALPFGQLDGENGVCTPFTESPHPHTRCVTVEGSGKHRTVTIVVTPQNPALAADTVIVERSLPKPANPFGGN